MPIVAQAVQDHLDMPTQLVAGPDLAIARGAALVAGRSSGTDVDEVLVDITPFTLAAGTLNDRLDGDLLASPVIPRGTVIPTTRDVTYFTVFDDQEAIELPIAQVESQHLDDNTVLGELRIDDLPASPEGSPVDVSFTLDLSGVLHVSATHRPSQRTATTTIRRGPHQLTEQRRERARERVEAMRSDGAEPSPMGGGGDGRLARSLLGRARRVLRDTAVTDATREAIEPVIEATERALSGDGDLDLAIEKLTDALYELD